MHSRSTWSTIHSIVRAVFLDRDGVIVENRDEYIRSWADVSFIPRAIDAIVRMQHHPYKVVIVTNQSAVGRGLLSLREANFINRQIIQQIENAGGRIDRVYMCPHAPVQACSCRKPEPGLLLKAARELNINMRDSILIGDALTDLEAGNRAGVERTVLVRTGRGRDQIKQKKAASLKPFTVHEDLYEALIGLSNE